MRAKQLDKQERDAKNIPDPTNTIVVKKDPVLKKLFTKTDIPNKQ